ncbi:MAG: hypothetical protein ACT4P6_14155 [Gemmatimonadaceae bacterium]
MPKSQRILRLFPSTLATERVSLLSTVVAALAAPLEEADTLLFRIQRAHRVKVAEHALDLVQLARALNLHEQDFADLLTDEALPHEAALGAVRRRIERVARLHLNGLGTPWAIIEAAAIMLDAELLRETPAASGLRRLDAAGYSHVATADLGASRGGAKARIYLHENPLRPRAVATAERYPLDSWLVSGDNVEPSPARIVIVGISDRAVLPTVFSPNTGEGIRFYGVIPDGSRLTIDAEDGARLDGRPVDEWVSFDVGGRADLSRYDGDAYIVERDGPRIPYYSANARLFTPPYRRVKPVPQIPPGPTEWRFGVAEGAYDAGDMDFCVYALPNEQRGMFDEGPGFDQSVFDFTASASVSMHWYERMPCAFKLLVPKEISGRSSPPRGKDEPAEEPLAQLLDLGRIAAFVARCKAAGVHAFVDAARSEWIVGEAMLREPNATSGVGIETAATVLRLEGGDLMLPIDPTSSTSES